MVIRTKNRINVFLLIIVTIVFLSIETKCNASPCYTSDTIKIEFIDNIDHFEVNKESRLKIYNTNDPQKKLLCTLNNGKMILDKQSNETHQGVYIITPYKPGELIIKVFEKADTDKTHYIKVYEKKYEVH